MWKKNRRSGKWSCFCCVGSSSEGVSSNQWLPLQCKLCMNINDVCYDNNEIYSDAHLKKNLCAEIVHLVKHLDTP